MMNPISTVYERLYIDVESLMPDKPQLWVESPAHFSVCNPRTTGKPLFNRWSEKSYQDMAKLAIVSSFDDIARLLVIGAAEPKITIEIFHLIFGAI